MNFRLAQPAVLIDINPLAELDYRARGRRAAHRRADAQPHARALAARRRAPAAPREAVPHVAHPQIRNRGTFGGNLAHADPASELPAVMLALGARLQAAIGEAAAGSTRSDFFTGALTTALRDDEMLVEVELPSLPLRTRHLLPGGRARRAATTR